jgi:hypothetical protein
MTDKRPQTIQFFLPQGEPRGIRIAEITTRIVQAVLVPRSKLPEAAKRDELNTLTSPIPPCDKIHHPATPAASHQQPRPNSLTPPHSRAIYQVLTQCPERLGEPVGPSA